MALKVNARHTGWLGFWFGSMKDFDATQPASILSKFWTLPGEDTEYSLLD